jgi:hypothetical protein
MLEAKEQGLARASLRASRLMVRALPAGSSD